MAKLILKIVLIFLLGAVGGIWAQISFLPFLADLPFFQDFQFVKDLKGKGVVLQPRTEITVQENLALRKMAEKMEKTTVGVKTKTPEGEVLEGSGVVVTSDGLVVTLAELVPYGSAFSFYIDGQWLSYQILKRDLKNNLALVKVDGGGLSTAGFADLEKIKLGERVFLVGTDFSTTTPQKFVNEGVIRIFNENLIQTTIFEKKISQGSPLFNIEGNVVGVCTVAKDGSLSAIPITVIRTFTGF